MTTPLKKPRPSSAKRVAAYRKRMRAQGLVPKTIWVPDLSDPGVIAEYGRQAKLLAERDLAGDDALEAIEKLVDWSE